MKTHHKKIENLKRTQNKINNIRNRPTENIIHNFSSYALSEEEKRALSFSLDENIPTKLNEKKKYKPNLNHFTGNFFNIQSI